MGIYINLFIVAERIDHKAWQDFYKETLTLLKAWPTPLLSLRTEKTSCNSTRLVYSQNIEYQEEEFGQTRQYWDVSGDLKSRQYGENYYLSDKLRRTLPGKEDQETNDPILMHLYGEGPGYNQFGNKTQGHPFHYAMLAVAMLAEARFPGAALTSGDFDREQALKASTEIERVLHCTVPLPICLDEERLFEAIVDDDFSFERLQNYLWGFYGPTEVALSLLCNKLPPETLYAFYTRRITRYNVGTIGFKDHCLQWLRQTKDLSGFIKMACLEKQGPQADPVDFANALVRTRITTSPDKERESLETMPPMETPKSVEDQFFLAMSKMSGLHLGEISFYTTQEDLIKHFETYFPDKIDDIKKEIQATHQKLHEELDQQDDGFKSFLAQLDHSDEEAFSSSFLEDLTKVRVDSPLSEEINTMLETLAGILEPLLLESKKTIPMEQQQDPQAMRKLIYRLSYHDHIAITDVGWKQIDQQEDPITLLLVLIFLSSARQNHEFIKLSELFLEYHDVVRVLRKKLPPKQ
ncbi:hypothetical protein ACQZV8_10160 [Magnetococcales bacterium HHB-1]